jgi:citrate lyase subunit beta/citryl-CoA lyase
VYRPDMTWEKLMTSNPKAPARSLRRSKLLAKGGTREIIAVANASGADVIQIELESGFSEQDRGRAVQATCQALRELDWSATEAWVRFRHIDAKGTREEIARVIAARPHLVYCAKVRSAEDIRRLDEAVAASEAASGIPTGSTQIGAVIERIEALAVVEEIAAASPRMGAIMFGANDMSLSFGYRRTGILGDNPETLYIRSRLVLAAKLARIDVFDAAWPNAQSVADSDRDASFSARMGFTGKTALTAGQLPGIHYAFRPSAKEMAWAREILTAAGAAEPHERQFDGEPITKIDVERATRFITRESA